MAPLERTRERIMLPFDRGRFTRDAADATVAYLGVEHAPPGTSRTLRGDDGTIVLETILSGPVVSVGPTGLVVEHGGFPLPIRHLLPAAIDLRALLGAPVSLAIAERHDGQRCTVDARLRDAHGALLMWARDGELPEDRVAHGLALRMRVEPEERGLAIAHRTGLSMVRGAGVTTVESDEGALLIVVLRVADEDAAFVALAR